MTIRQKEDREALAALEASAVHLPFLDAGYGTSYELEDLTPVLAQHLDAVNPECVLLPLGIWHADHLATHKAAVSLIRARPHIQWIDL